MYTDKLVNNRLVKMKIIEFQVTNFDCIDDVLNSFLSVDVKGVERGRSTVVLKGGKEGIPSVLQTMYLFGHAGAGKTTLIRAIQFALNYIKNSCRMDVDNIPTRTSHRGVTTLEFALTDDVNIYNYGFGVEFGKNRMTLKTEYLYLKNPNEEDTLVLFERNIEENKVEYGINCITPFAVGVDSFSNALWLSRIIENHYGEGFPHVCSDIDSDEAYDGQPVFCEIMKSVGQFFSNSNAYTNVDSVRDRHIFKVYRDSLHLLSGLVNSITDSPNILLLNIAEEFGYRFSNENKLSNRLDIKARVLNNSSGMDKVILNEFTNKKLAEILYFDEDTEKLYLLKHEVVYNKPDVYAYELGVGFYHRDSGLKIIPFDEEQSLGFKKALWLSCIISENLDGNKYGLLLIDDMSTNLSWDSYTHAIESLVDLTGKQLFLVMKDPSLLDDKSIRLDQFMFMQGGGDLVGLAEYNVDFENIAFMYNRGRFS